MSDIAKRAYFNQKYKIKQYLVAYLSKKLLGIIELLKIQILYTKKLLKFNIYIYYKNLLYFIIIKQLN